MSFLKELNSAQRDAVKAVDGPVMIVAGAGSGKTRVLTYRLAHLVELGVRPETILALTFTNKAAGEMKSRLVQLVGERSRAVWMGTPAPGKFVFKAPRGIDVPSGTETLLFLWDRLNGCPACYAEAPGVLPNDGAPRRAAGRAVWPAR